MTGLDLLNKEFLLTFLKFGLVGFFGIFVDFGFTYLLKEKLKVHKYLANSVGFIVATVSNYFFNRYWTFSTGNSIRTDPFEGARNSKMISINVN